MALLFILPFAPPASAQSQESAGPASGPAAASGAVSGLPLPRFVSLRAGEVNLRSGPGVQYPVDWVYQRRYLPMEVIAEFQTWRKVRDHQGTLGWVHQSMLSGNRTGIVLGRVRALRSEPNSTSRALARMEPDVIINLLECPSAQADNTDSRNWCHVRAAGIDGWLRRVELWGVRRDEVIE